MGFVVHLWVIVVVFGGRGSSYAFKERTKGKKGGRNKGLRVNGCRSFEGRTKGRKRRKYCSYPRTIIIIPLFLL